MAGAGRPSGAAEALQFGTEDLLDAVRELQDALETCEEANVAGACSKAFEEQWTAYEGELRACADLPHFERFTAWQKNAARVLCT